MKTKKEDRKSEAYSSMETHRKGTAAWASGDVVEILRCFKELKECE